MIEIRHASALRTTWTELKTNIKNDTSPLNIGDEIDIVLKTGEKVTLVCERVGHRSATFFTKNLLEDTHCMNVNWAAENGEQMSTMEAYLGKLFLLLPDDLQKVVSEPLRLLREKEVFGKNKYGNEEVCEVLPRYSEKKNRVKTLTGVPFPYWLATPYVKGTTSFCRTDSGGSDQLETWRFQEWVKDELPDYVDKLSGARWIAYTDARPIFNVKYTHNIDNKAQYMPLMEFSLNVNEWFIFNPTLKECGHIPFNVHSEKYFKTFFDEV